MKVLLDDHVLDGIHGRFQQCGVRGVGVMDIDLAVWDSVDAAETVREVPCCGIKVRAGACVVGEMLGDGGDGEFPLEEIDLVEEKDDGFPLEPLAVDQGFKEHHGFVHLVLWHKLATDCRKMANEAVDLPRSGLQQDIGRIQTEQP